MVQVKSVRCAEDINVEVNIKGDLLENLIKEIAAGLASSITYICTQTDDYIDQDLLLKDINNEVECMLKRGCNNFIE